MGKWWEVRRDPKGAHSPPRDPHSPPGTPKGPPEVAGKAREQVERSGTPQDPQRPPKGTPGIPKKRDRFFD